jgi:hypothetical protein
LENDATGIHPPADGIFDTFVSPLQNERKGTRRLPPLKNDWLGPGMVPFPTDWFYVHLML